MIEVKNLKKTYVTKGSVTHALDDVSIKFPEKGLVFLLGKSGSGKSTLLNSMGGLDTVDSGEIIIMGRSSSTFSGSDFDSYRNTFVGFIFQDYNILNEFSVEENLSLALELQGKKANKERVLQLLEEVDLKGFEKRKPNTLSGGQKQRIAIARALIKEPKIIMADEPTGALDSKTGKQVFDTLKKLSEEKLIIVVSHDREFAEIYGDRIIELKDGKILSDEVKTHVEARELNENISVIGANTLSIKNSANLSASDKDEIIKFITNGDGNVIIAANDREIKSFKRANRISDDNKTEVFENTKDIKMAEYSEEDRKFIKSKLPLSKATRMGLSSLKIKPFRLLITMFLTIVSFTLFGVSSSLMNYNSSTVTKNSFNKSDYTSLAVKNNYKTTTNYYKNDKLVDSYSSTRNTVFTNNDLNNLYSTYGDDVLALYATSNSWSSNFAPTNIEALSTTPKTLQNSSIAGFANPNNNSKYRNMLAGSMPTLVNEIAIPDFYANIMLKSKYTDPTTSTEIVISSMADLVDKKLRFNIGSDSYDFKITGVYKSDDITGEYKDYNNADVVNEWSDKKIEDFKAFISETPHKIFFITKQTYKNIVKATGYDPKQENQDYNSYFTQSNGYVVSYGSTESQGYLAEKISNAKLPIKYIGTHTSQDNGIVISANNYINILNNLDISKDDYDFSLLDIDDETLKERYKDFTLSASDMYLSLAKEKNTADEVSYFEENFEYYYNKEALIQYYHQIGDSESANAIYEDPQYITASEKVTNEWERYYNFTNKDQYKNREYNSLTQFSYFYGAIVRHELSPSIIYNIMSYLNTDNGKEALNIYLKLHSIFELSSVQIKIDGENSNTTAHTLTRDIIGFYIEEQTGYSPTGIYVPDDDYEYYRRKSYSIETTNYTLEDSDEYYSEAYIPTANSPIFKNLNKVNQDGSVLKANNSLYEKINLVTELVNILKTAFFYVGLVLAIFSALLLFNFITVSIASKTHEIGVLRAVGARGKDVFKIFFSESFFIAMLSFVIALIGSIILVVSLNNYMTEKLSYPLQLLTFGPLSIILMIGISLAVAIVGTFIPVLIISRKKPVDSLRAQ